MLNSVGKVLQGADGDRLLRGVLAAAVGLGQLGDDDLGVALGAQGPGFQQRLVVIYTSKQI